LGEANAFLRQTIDLIGVNALFAVAGQVGIAHVVDQDEQHIRGSRDCRDIRPKQDQEQPKAFSHSHSSIRRLLLHDQFVHAGL